MRERVHPVVWGLVALLPAIEAFFEAGDAGLIRAWREPAYLLAVGAIPPSAALTVPGALPWFVGGLFGHALLHDGWTHVIFNSVGLLCLGHVVQAQAGTRAFLASFLVTALAGAILFLLLAPANSMMVGASGAVFGLLGIVLRWRSNPIALWRVLVVLAALSLPAGLVFGAAVAWQAHLGGFLCGWLLGAVMPPRRRIIHPLM